MTDKDGMNALMLAKSRGAWHIAGYLEQRMTPWATRNNGESQ
jgi:hypothetical protein